MTFVSQLDPLPLWKHFDNIMTIPRGSKNETQINAYIIDLAQKLGLTHAQDDVGNLVVNKPGTSGFEKARFTILQSHTDMVNEKNADINHDFLHDAIRPRREGQYLYATGTTLGADNGIGVAAELAIMESDALKHGPLELLFTVDEETGLTGAGGLKHGLLKGKQLINLDTEEEGILYVGCAGGAGVNLTIGLTDEKVPADSAALKIKLHGLRGGHSGCDIHLQKGNAIKLLGRALNSLSRTIDFVLADFRGGNVHNAIPREAFATAVLAVDKVDDLRNGLTNIISDIKSEFQPAEPEMAVMVDDDHQTEMAFSEKTTRQILNLVNALPHGVMAMSYDIPELVETSSNLASVKIQESEMTIHISNRSSGASAIQGLQERIASIGRLANAQTGELEGYPGWKPDLASPLLALAKTVHKDVLGDEPDVKAVHAGLECGIIGERYPGMDMVSLGPQIENPHSPDERVHIKSVADFYIYLTALLQALATEA